MPLEKEESNTKSGITSASEIQPQKSSSSDVSSPSQNLAKRHVIATKDLGKRKTKSKKSGSKSEKEGAKKSSSFKVADILKKRNTGSIGSGDVAENVQQLEKGDTKDKTGDKSIEKKNSSFNIVDLTQQSSTQSQETTSSTETVDKSTKAALESSKTLDKVKEKKETASSKTTKKGKTKGSKKTQVKSHVLTDYFPVRRSSRKPKSVLQKEQDEILIENIMSKTEDGLEVVEFEKKGRGVVAKRAFRKGSFIVEYAGELIDWPEAKRREGEYSKDSSIGCYMYYFVFNNVNYCVDATSESGRLGRLLNHSRKNPNCKTRLVGVQDESGKGVVPRLVIIAKQDISAGEELTYDYGDKDKDTLQSHPWLKST